MVCTQRVSAVVLMALSAVGPFVMATKAAPASAAPAPTISLAGPEVYKVDWNSRALQAADMDGDGLKDVVLINNDRASVDILQQRKPGAGPDLAAKSVRASRWEPVLEDARFRKTSVTTGVTMFDLATGDLNGDGRADLAYTGDPQALTIRYRQADGSWLEKKITEAPAPIQFVSGMRIADLNGDTRADLVMLGQKEVAIFYQDKSGQLEAPERFALPDENCYGLELCDVDGDGQLDLVYLSSGRRDALRIRRQNAQRQFGPEQAYTVKSARSTLQILQQAKGKERATFVAALNVTGQLDIFRLEPDTQAASVAIRPRVFTPRAGTKTPASYAFGDFDGDDREDIAVSDADGAQVFVYFRQKDGGFTGAKRFPSLADGRALASGDWNGDGKVDLFVASAKEQTVGVASVTTDGRLGYPQPLPVTGKPLAIAAGRLTNERGAPTSLLVLREEKGRRSIDVFVRKEAGAELVRSFDVAGVKTDPRAIRLVDANQDGRQDVAVFTPLDAMKVYLQKEDGAFAEATAASGFRRGLVDNVDAAAFSVGDVDGDGKDEMLINSGSFSRALRVSATGELTVVDQFNARDTTAEIAASVVFSTGKGKAAARTVALYDRKGEQFQLLQRDAQGVYQVVDSAPAGKLDVVAAEIRRSGREEELFLLGKDRFWWAPLGRDDLTATTVASYTTDIPEVSYSDVIAGDLNHDGKVDLVAVDPDKNVVEVLATDASGNWESKVHFKVFETDEHYQGRKGSPQEPRETIIADVSGDGKNDLVLLVHDRILVYPQEKN